MARQQTTEDFRHEIPIYPVSLYIFWVTDKRKERQFEKLFGLDFLEISNQKNTVAVVHNDGNPQHLLLVVFRAEDFTPDAVAHEALHIVQYVEDVIGETLSREAAAYLLSWVFKTIESTRPEK